MRSVLLPVFMLVLLGCGPMPPSDLMREVEALDDAPWRLETLRGESVVPLMRVHEDDDEAPSSEAPPAHSPEDMPSRDERRPATIEFVRKDDGWFLRGFSGCNTFTASCTINESAFQAGPVSGTRMSCPADTLENRFLQALGQASQLRLKRNALYLIDADTVLATFVPVF